MTVNRSNRAVKVVQAFELATFPARLAAGAASIWITGHQLQQLRACTGVVLTWCVVAGHTGLMLT